MDSNNLDLIESLDKLDRLHYEAEKLTKLNKVISNIEAIKKYKEVVRFAKEKKDIEIEFIALIKIGNIYSSLTFIDKSIEFYQLALNIFNQNQFEFAQMPGLKFSDLLIITSLSGFFQSLGEYQKAIILFR